MQGLATATLDRALNADTKGAPEWVHLLPNGYMQGRDGRSFDLADPGGLILAFQANGIDLPVDYQHQNDNPEARLKGPVPAAGWIKELQQRDDGIWGRVEWTATAADLICAKEYRFISPSFLHHPKTHEIMRLKGAGLVHNPNLYLTALAAQETQMTQAPATPAQPDLQAFCARLTKLLGLPADAAPDALLAKISAATAVAPDPAKYMPIAAVQEMLQDRRMERTENDTSRKADKVERAAKEHFITNGMKSWALALCQSDEAAFDDFCKSSGPTLAYLFRENPAFSRGSAAEPYTATPLEAAICEQLGLKPGALKD